MGRVVQVRTHRYRWFAALGDSEVENEKRRPYKGQTPSVKFLWRKVRFHPSRGSSDMLREQTSFMLMRVATVAGLRFNHGAPLSKPSRVTEFDGLGNGSRRPRTVDWRPPVLKRLFVRGKEDPEKNEFDSWKSFESHKPRASTYDRRPTRCICRRARLGGLVQRPAA